MLSEFPTRNTKLYFESQAGICIASMCEAIVFQNEFESRTQLEDLSSSISNIYSTYLQTLDESQVDINDVDNSFFASAEIQTELQQIMQLTISERTRLKGVIREVH